MKLSRMKFGEFQWPNNPAVLRVSRRREIQEVKLTSGESSIQDRGAEKRIVEGEGEFFGSACAETYQRLSALLETGGTALLSLPGLPPFSARFVSLLMTEQAQPELIHYQFTFWEDGGSHAAAEKGPVREYTAREGDNLWSVAAEYGTTADRLLELNPSIRWPNYLSGGERVVLP